MALVKETEIFVGQAESFLASIVGDAVDFSVRKDKYVLAFSTTVTFITAYVIALAISYPSKIFRSLSNREKVFWCLSIVRAWFGVLITVLGWLCWFDEKLHVDPVYASTPISNFSISVALGFFFFEASMLLGANLMFRYFDPALASHHVLALYLYWTTLHLNKFASFIIQSLLLEMTTPFSCLCWILIKTNKAHTTVWKANQMVLIHLFHCRSIIEFGILYQAFVHRREIWTSSHPAHVFMLTVATVLCAFWMTPFWLYKKTWQLFNPVDWNHSSSTSAEQGVATNGGLQTPTSVKQTDHKHKKID